MKKKRTIRTNREKEGQFQERTEGEKKRTVLPKEGRLVTLFSCAHICDHRFIDGLHTCIMHYII